MGTWATASLFTVSMLCLQLQCNSEVFQQNQRKLPEPFLQQFYVVGSGVPEQQSASELQPPNMQRMFSTNYLLGNVDQDHNFPPDESQYENMDRHFEKKLEQAAEEYPLTDNFEDYKTSQSTHTFGPQIETIQSEHYHAKVAPFDVSEFKHEHEHGHHEEHGEVHYHEHKHHHKHEHKQEHKHHHKQAHEHKHKHEQHHEHKHHQEHKHKHEHKHGHHQHHKHDHHHGHKHDHHHGHKHEHKHGHKHEHHNEHKHHHKHGHHHGHKHGHKHHSKHH